MESAPIILIDDDIEDIEMLREMSSRLRLDDQVLAFTDPIAALEFLANTIVSPLCIICDINMPKLDGFQLSRAMLNTESPVKESPFFFLSTSKTDNELIATEELKITGYYKKSNTFSGIKAILQSFIDSLRK